MNCFGQVSKLILPIALVLILGLYQPCHSDDRRILEVFEDAATALDKARIDLNTAREDLEALPKKYEKIVRDFSQLKSQIINIESSLDSRIKQSIVRYSPKYEFIHVLRKNKTYNASPRQCIEECNRRGLHMATVDEVLGWASGRNNKCAWMWMLDSSNPDKVLRGFPMFINRTKGGCGRANTGDRPRIEGKELHEWDSSILSDCACAGAK